LSLPELNNTNESDRCGWWFPILSNDVHSDAYKRPKLGGSSGSVRSLVHRANRRESSIILSLMMLSGRLEIQLLQRREAIKIFRNIIIWEVAICEAEAY
jgi:hypothetical protein